MENLNDKELELNEAKQEVNIDGLRNRIILMNKVEKLLRMILMLLKRWQEILRH